MPDINPYEHLDINKYIVYTTASTGETLYNYTGNNIDEARDEFYKQRNYIMHKEVIEYDVEVVFKNSYTDEIIDSYSPLDDNA